LTITFLAIGVSVSPLLVAHVSGVVLVLPGVEYCLLVFHGAVNLKPGVMTRIIPEESYENTNENQHHP
jgi:hypothetical protein